MVGLQGLHQGRRCPNLIDLLEIDSIANIRGLVMDKNASTEVFQICYVFPSETFDTSKAKLVVFLRLESRAALC